jgi:phosphate-selective porin OprO and OprP
VGLEHLQADVNITFNERSMATDLVPNRDIGVELHGDLFRAAVSYAAGIFNGAPDYSGTTANADYDDNKAFAGRIFFQPFKPTSIPVLENLGLGVGGSYEDDQASHSTTLNGLTPGLLTDGQQTFFKYNSNVFANGPHWRTAPQGYYYYGPFSLLGEYVVNDQEVRTVKNGPTADLQNTAWEITAGWVLTGEDASYNGVTPRQPFDPRAGYWGALQLVARGSELNVDKDAFPLFANPATSAYIAHEWAVGLNWYLNRNIRVNASGSRTTFDGGSGATAVVTKQPEEVFFTRVQLGF